MSSARSGSDSHVPVAVLLRPLGTPLTIGLSGLAIASLVQCGVELGWLARTGAKDAGLLTLTVPFLLQLLACVFAYLARDGAAGAAMGVLATTWLGLGLVQLTSSPGSTSGALGLELLAAGGLLALSSVVVGIGKPLVGVIFLLAAARFVLAGSHELTGTVGLHRAAGGVGLVVVALASYAVAAFELEGQQHRAVLPTLRRGRGRSAMSDGTADSLGELTQEPGVRQIT